MGKLDSRIASLERCILVAIFALLVLLTGAQIVLRNLFESGLVWADDAIKVLVLWLAMSGALYATRGAKHINIDVITRFLPEDIAALIRRVLFLLSSLICGCAAWASYQFVLLEFEDPSIAFLKVPTWLTEAIIPIALALMAVRFLSMVICLPLIAEQDQQESGQ